MEEQYGPYKLLRKIATGGMAEIFLAHQCGIEGFEREVIIKKILPERTENPEFCTMFLDEARLVAKLRHPYIAQVYSLDRIKESYYISMEYVDGIELADLLDRAKKNGKKGLPLPISIPIIAALCEALAYIHSRTDEFGQSYKIVHRDLNPHNVMISYEGAVKLIDFGIAKAESQVYDTAVGVIKGTYGYMAPEQVTHKYPIDSRTDLFALGVVAYELTTGHHPFEGTDEVTFLGRLVQNEFEPPSKISRSYPPQLERLILKCMSPTPEQRPSSARRVLSLIEDFSLRHKFPLTMSRIAKYVAKAPVRDLPGFHQPPLQSVSEACSPAQTRKPKSNNTQKISLDDISPDEVITLVDSRKPEELSRKEASRNKNQKNLLNESEIKSQKDPSTLRPASPAIHQSKWNRRRTFMAALTVFSIGIVFSLPSLTNYTVSFDSLFIQGDENHQEIMTLETLSVAENTILSDGSISEISIEKSVIYIKSEPDNAYIWLDGKALNQKTPAKITVPHDKDLIWIGVTLDGYRPEARQIDSAAGEAMFTLSKSAQLSPDDDK